MYTTPGQLPEVVEVPTPEPGPGEVRLKVTAAGACHSDSFLLSLPAEQLSAMGFPLPLSLGHEGAGIVDKLGPGVSNVEVGTSVAVYGPQGCGRCYVCAQGKENYCPHAAAMGIFPPGLGAPGAMAEYMIVPDARHLLALGDLDPVQNVALTDAGLTPYHAIKIALPALVPGSTVLVIGSGGLGHIGIQILKAISPATVIVADIAPDKLELAKDVGADYVVNSGNASAVEEIMAVTGGRPVSAVVDFVGFQPTFDLGAAVVGMGSPQVLVGAGAISAKHGLVSGRPYESMVVNPYWGSRHELIEVFELARKGLVHVETEVFSLDDAPEAYRRLHDGTLRGRAVVVPSHPDVGRLCGRVRLSRTAVRSQDAGTATFAVLGGRCRLTRGIGGEPGERLEVLGDARVGSAVNTGRARQERKRARDYGPDQEVRIAHGGGRPVVHGAAWQGDRVSRA